jgi:hypothetical protein
MRPLEFIELVSPLLYAYRQRNSSKCKKRLDQTPHTDIVAEARPVSRITRSPEGNPGRLQLPDSHTCSRFI